MLAVFGVLMTWPKPLALVTARLGGVFNRANAVGSAAGSGNLGGFVLGTTIGVLWTPCAGPMLGSILTLVATAEDLTRAGTLLVGYAVGAALAERCFALGWIVHKRDSRLVSVTPAGQRALARRLGVRLK